VLLPNPFLAPPPYLPLPLAPEAPASDIGTLPPPAFTSPTLLSGEAPAVVLFFWSCLRVVRVLRARRIGHLALETCHVFKDGVIT